MLPLITLEEHFVSRNFKDARYSREAIQNRFPTSTVAENLTLGPKRLQDMENGDVSLQVISHVPSAASSLEICQMANSELCEAVEKNDTRFAGFAMLPMSDPAAASEELTRCVKEYHFVGALVGEHVNGRRYDDKFFWPVFEKAQELDVPIYLHPAAPTPERLAHFEGNYSKEVATLLSVYAWGWHSDTGLHILRLFASGLFDQYPRLKIIIGHMGEMLPFMLDRIAKRIDSKVQTNRTLRTVWNENIWVTTSGMFSVTPFACLLRAVKIDRILYSVDYPMSTNEEGKEFIEDVRKSGLVTDDELEMIAYRNAAKLLKLRDTR